MEAAILGLTREGNELVARRDSRKKPLSTKLAEDVIALLCCLKNKATCTPTLPSVPTTQLSIGLDIKRRYSC